MAFGVGTGNTATGLALVRAVDPDSNSSAPDNHGIYSAVMCWKEAFAGLVPMWTMSGIGMTVGVGGVRDLHHCRLHLICSSEQKNSIKLETFAGQSGNALPCSVSAFSHLANPGKLCYDIM